MPNHTPDTPYVTAVMLNRAATTPLAATGFQVTLDSLDPEHIHQAFAASGLTSAHLRSRTAMVCDIVDDSMLCALAYLAGFAGGLVDVVVGDVQLRTVELYAKASAFTASDPPDLPCERVVVGPPSPMFSDDVLLDLDTQPTAQQVALVRSAKTVVCSASALSGVERLVAVLVVAGMMRRHSGQPRHIHWPLVQTDVSRVPVALGDAYRAGVNARVSARHDDRSTVVAALSPSRRQQQLLAAASLPIEQVLGRLGAKFNPEIGKWHCPRPQEHSNGDAKPSLTISEQQVRCMRCDGEPLDALRLTMSVRAMTPDAAAAWLLTEPAA